jgi:hypothetical protein
MNQILISLGILALWALTSLLSRDAQPLPPRATRDRRDDPNRRLPSVARDDLKGSGGITRSGDRRTAELTDARLAARLGENSLSRYGGASARSSNDDIRILESSPRTTRSVGSPAGAIGSAASILTPGSRGSSRRGIRSRSSSSGAASKPQEPERPRALTSQVNKSMAKLASRPLEITPLEQPLESLSSSLVPLGTRRGVDPTRSESTAPALNAKTVAQMLSSPQKLREVAILTELLQPPLALRQRRRIR